MKIYCRSDLKDRKVDLFKLLRMLNKYNVNSTPLLRDELFSSLFALDDGFRYSIGFEGYLKTQQANGKLSYKSGNEQGICYAIVDLKDKKFGNYARDLNLVIDLSMFVFDSEYNFPSSTFVNYTGSQMGNNFKFFDFCLNAEEKIINNSDEFAGFKGKIIIYFMMRLILDYQDDRYDVNSLGGIKRQKILDALNKFLVIFVEHHYGIESNEVDNYPYLLDDGLVGLFSSLIRYRYSITKEFEFMINICNYIRNNPECAIARYVNQHKNSLRCGHGR